MDLPKPDPDAALRVIVEELIDDFSDLEPTEVGTVAREEFEDQAAHSKVPGFVGILSERRARDRLGILRDGHAEPEVEGSDDSPGGP